MSNHDTFSGQSETHIFDGFLFDLDGTIIDTTEAITKHWQKIGAELGVDAQEMIHSSRGRRSIDTIKHYNPAKANWDYVSHIESLIPIEYGSTASETPGARPLLSSLQNQGAPWALVTSCTRPLLQIWISLLSLPPPPISITAEDVEIGKPDPACYKLGRQRIGSELEEKEARVLVVEDSPSGVRAGKAAGCKVLGLTTTHEAGRVREAGADWVVEDLRAVKVVGREREGKGWKVSLDRIWQKGESGHGGEGSSGK